MNMPGLTKERLMEYADLLTFLDGEFSQLMGKVKNQTAAYEMNEFGEQLLSLSAVVQTNSRPYYFHPEASLEADTGELYGAYCDCADFQECEGLCEHCIALLLDYMQNDSAYRVPVFDDFLYEEVKPARRTDLLFAELLQKCGKREMLAIEGETDPFPVHLEATLNLNRGKAFLTFRIGTERLYVVQDAYAMIERVYNTTEYSYGKRLSFVHRIEAFDEQSRPLVEYLVRQYGFYYARNYGQKPKAKEFGLGAHQLDEVLALMSRDKILISRNKKTAEVWEMVDGNPPWSLSLLWEDGGASLHFEKPDRLQTISYNYYFKDHVIYRLSRSERMEVEELEDYLYSGAGQNNFIAEEDLPLFVRQMLPVIEKHYTLEPVGDKLARFLPEEAEFRIYLDLPQDDMITCDLVAVYADEREYHVFEGIPQKGNRNVRQEMQASAHINRYCNAFDSANCLAVASADERCMYIMLTEGIPSFREFGEVYISDRLKRIAEIRRPTVHVGVSLTGNLLDLEVDPEGMSIEELAAILSKYDRRKKFYRLKSGEFISMDEDDLETLTQVKKGLMLTDKEMAEGHMQVPKFCALFLNEQLKENDGIPVEKSRDFKALIRQMHTVEDSDHEVPKSLDKILRSYQKTGYRWIETLYTNGFGGILADDMGLGKTLQVIAFLLAHYEKKKGALRSLIICPASLVYNWENECRTFAPSLPVLAIAGSTMERKAMLDTFPERVVAVTSYDLLKRDIDRYQEINFDYQIIDEAQFIKNANTKAAHAVKMVPAGFRMALTGTPVENRLSELWSIFDYLMPGYLYRYQQFREEIETPIVSKNDADAMQRLQKLIAPFVLRRLKKDVLKDLPDKLERNVVARIEGEQRKLYEAHVQRLQLFLNNQSAEEFAHSKIEVLAELTKLRQLCCDPALLYENYAAGSAKLDLCLELTENAVEGGHKLLIFSQFTTMLERIASRLNAKKIRYYMLTGSTSKKERMKMVNAFDQDEIPVFLISLKAGGTGLNLTAADIVIHYDPWWNTAAQNQATDRTHRIGQKNVVNVYRLIAKDTIEEKIIKLQERKSELADEVLGGSGTASPSFSKEELLELLSGRG